MGLSIMPFVRLWYPLTLWRLLHCAADRSDPAALVAGIDVDRAVVYLYRATQVLHDDYWAASNARFDLEERARQLELLT